MLDSSLKEQLRIHLEKLQFEVSLVATVDDSQKSSQLTELIDDIAELSPKVSSASDGQASRTPSFEIRRSDSDVAVEFAGIPMGHEFTSLVLAILQVGGHPPSIDDAVRARIEQLDANTSIETYFSQTCQICPDVVQALNTISVLNPGVRHVSIDGALFAGEVEEREILSIPTIFRDGEPFEQGGVTIEQLVSLLEDAPSEDIVNDLNDRDAYDVLVVGGGPAGSAAAVYSARKGIRTGLVAEKFGGQLLDTLGIENLISTDYTEGPKLSRQLEQNVRANDVDVITDQRVAKLFTEDALHRVELESGAKLEAKTVILSTGARWRELGVPGEREYKNKGVAYCPHCDGPLYKGKRVAVVGGGNSGVEAAIDLAGIVEHVTLLEFDGQLRADEVLQTKLRSLSNTDIVLNAATTEVTGDGKRVNGLKYEDRNSGDEATIDLEGVFVQIGLLPNTEWLDGTVELNQYGEIKIDDRGATSREGVFAAGDCTTVPYKQIVISMGAGSTAALSAFDHLVRS